MKPYYQDKWVTIYHGDCREILPQLPRKVDLVLTDPPYGLNFEYPSYIDSLDNLRTLIAEVFPLLRATRICLTCAIKHYDLYPKADWVCAVTWDTTGSYGKCGVSQWFPILFYGNDIPGFGAVNGQIKSDTFRITGGGDVGFQRGKEESLHTCPKPFKLWKRIVTRFTLQGDFVLDPFMGIGTTLKAAKESNRYSIGIEIEEKYCEIAARRCSQEVMELV